MRSLAALGAVVITAGCAVASEQAAPRDPSVQPIPTALHMTPAPAQPTAPPPEPSELLGLVPDSVSERLGRPNHVWREDPGMMWQFVQETCVLSVFFHPVGSSRQVIDVQLVDRKGKAVETPACYVDFPVGALPSAKGTS